MASSTPPPNKNPTTTANDSKQTKRPPETPRSHRSHGGKAGVTALRPIIAVEMDREFIKVPIDTFIKAYLPFEPCKATIDRIIECFLPDSGSGSPVDATTSSGECDNLDIDEQLQIAVGDGDSLMLRHGGHLMFRAFHRPPSTSDGSEKLIYGPLQDIAHHISLIDNLIPGRDRNEYHYRYVSSNMIKSEIDGSNNKIDACFMRGEEFAKPSTHNIAVVIEQKLLPEQRGGNNRQAVSANVQIMNDDVRRMFTYGITIESDLVTVWYHSRSHSAVSEQFSLVKQPELLLKVFTSFLYASKEELGYDPGVEHISKGHYVFRGIPNVKDRNVLDTYKTVGTISEIRANNITGRMARVFKAVKLNPATGRYGTKKYVLKDVWIDETAETERALQDAIFGDIEKFWSTRKTPQALELIKERHRNLVASKGYKKYFLTIENDYEGALTKPLAEGFQSIRGLLSGPPLDDEKIETSASHARLALHTQLMGHTIPESTAYDQFSRIDFERKYARKKQYRLVFSELCTTVGHLETLGEVIDVLFQALIPLEMMLCAGWVHRDISSGNIMAYRKNLDDAKQPWRVVLADLEYAKKYPPPEELSGSSDPKTGTPFFMPIEVMMQRSLFDHNQEKVTRSVAIKSDAGNSQPEGASLSLQPADSDDDDDDYVRFKEDTLSAPKNRAAAPWEGIVHNFQHDWESIWWLILWTITSRVVDASEDAKSYARKIFQNSIKASSQRQKAFMEPIRPDLEKCLGPLSNYFAETMEYMRGAMYRRYVLRELRGQLKDVSSFARVSLSFRSFFGDLQEHTEKWSSTKLNMKNPYIEPAERKRPLPDDEEGGQNANAKGSKPRYASMKGSRKGQRSTK
ncbi:hypothetical protein JR316_0008468 [Psilocybe cubensis]|uniref:Uncharacterized protein n=2 Tax=Psilocybe cubensis TaxID=181762 RepID=A0ACB8GWQ1_PSICU|nr:hypothetical protein JR316_0008468 [Psilocybe cubensis]KAH9479872.1 hypothetical protein JR316_0008468 [Psilocybe cubensis]